ncbi:isochorismatase family protein [Actinomadura barringtoniae]|uniref:Isochorismatase family protein n=1 Tax=Actinomadura barringtoniae TaxID=1427535 RepID=A0A939P8Q6_9ACTN|nr:isochorismatase family protein [Actinomadura barringtoniae]MBO2447840.1 isochorismatase family protein [Actinomadura barringtoniae]
MNDKDVDADYAAAGFGGVLPLGSRPVVLVVDVVRAYLEPESPLYAAVEEAVDAAARLVDGARRHGVPVIFTRVEFGPGGVNGGLFYRKVPALRCFDAGSPLGDFSSGLRPTAAETVVVKQYASAFFGTSLAATLTALRVDTVFIAGLSTSGCVRATAVDALQHGFVPAVVREACGDRDSRPHEAALFDLRAKYAEVVSLTDALDHLARVAPAGGART